MNNKPIPIARVWSRKGNCPECGVVTSSRHRESCIYSKIGREMERAKKLEVKDTRLKRVVILNTSIITNFGDFRYMPITYDDVYHNVQAYKEAGIEILSTVGHESTAQILTELLGVEIPVNRIQYKQELGDRVFVFKLNGRPEEGKILTKEEIIKVDFSFGLLQMLKQLN